MQQRQLGPPSHRSLTTSAIGLGCMGLSQGYGPTEDAESIKVIRHALDLGVTMLDTAMSYGQGHNEQLLARALKGVDRTGVMLASKFGIVRDEDGVHVDGRPEHVRGYCDASLSRLGVDFIDLYYLHRVDPDVPITDTVSAMAELVEQGKVGHLGLSEVTVDQLAQAAAVHPITAVQFEWSLLWREPELDIVPAARRLGAGLVPYSPLGRGLLTATLGTHDIDTSEFRRADARFHGEHLDANLAQIDALGQIAEQLQITTGQLALAWLLAQGPDVVPIPGTRRLDRVGENTCAADVELAPVHLARIDELAPRTSWSGDRQSFAAPHTARAPR